MPELDASLSFDPRDTQRAWDLLTERIEAFVEQWESTGQAPALAEFAPRSPAELRRMALVELIKVDLEYRWQPGGERRLIEQYLDEFPELADGGTLSCDLLYEEYHVRLRAGDQPRAEQYFERFPQQADGLRRLLGIDSGRTTTALLSAARHEAVEPGERLDDFDLLTRLGKGAFATVFLARQRSMQRMVALKVSANSGNEPQTLAQLDHPGIVRVFDQRILPERQMRLLYMQYVAGGTLQQAIEWARQLPLEERSGRTLVAAVDRALLERGESPPAESAARARLQHAGWVEVVALVGAQLAGALQYAHRRGVLHRDLKPANILLSGEAAPKLVDFNISFCSKLEGASPAAYFGGSLAYMSPEQLQACDPDEEREADSLDERSDLYSLGVVLWELLTGARPFADEAVELGWGRTLKQMTERRLAGVNPAAIERMRAAGAGELGEVLLKLLAPRPEDRYASASEAARELRLCLAPEARRLLRPGGGWKGAVRRVPLTALLATLVAPNAVAAWFNYTYNRQTVVERLQDSQAVFWNVQAVINTLAFSLGIGLAVLLSWPIVRVVRQRRWLDPAHGHRLPPARKMCLRLGHYAVLLGVAEWLVAGFAFPIAMHAGGVSLQPGDYVHFIASLALCGLIAATYPFFGVTTITVRAMYPLLIRHGAHAAAEVESLTWLHRISSFYLVLAALLPMLGVMLLVLAGDTQNRLAMGALSAAGVLGFALIFALARRLQYDLSLLAETLSQSDDETTDTESFRAKLR